MNYYQRHFMQHLRSGNWVSVSALPDSPSTKVKVVEFGWVERRGRGPEVCYRITESGLEALRAPIPRKSKSSLDSGPLSRNVSASMICSIASIGHPGSSALSALTSVSIAPASAIQTAAPIGHLPSANRATWRFPMRILKMYAHRIPRSLGGLFSDNKPDPAPDATRYDDAVLIPGEPEARDIGSRDRIAVDFVISHHNWSPADRVRGVRLVY